MTDVTDLTQVPLFAALEANELETLASMFDVKSVGEGTTLVREGAAGYSFYVLLEGAATVTVGEETLATYGPGDFFGETGILDGARRNATVTTTTSAQLLVMFGTEFRVLEQQHPSIAARLRDATEQRKRELVAVHEARNSS